ncbi:hypothetical protein [Agrobacterium tumefaciens]|uniref:hypothetical protein n=1 Tax=Agrobacterium tumefaciens TaxID=358 RepID=UPI0015737999|nr:hypothetical protein [Agrobacterium tumefaciens]NSY51663.1 hypothetical protein [Agrobacterium tumefaciens]NTA45926.1 hypothetical protein [Agrobacterium tumefaciens]WCK17094.1 hypothetical protein G6L41_025510 [Agrobacterium tumefaciens]WIE36452.1 hypothetical protein G6L82_026275 [Agrobacterium tumefaciens]
MLNDPWAPLVSSIRRRRAPDARFFKPVCLIGAIDLSNEGLLDPTNLNAEAIVSRFKAYVGLVFESRAEMGWKPLWHLSNDGLWNFYANGIALEPDDFGADRPGTKSILFNRFQELVIADRYRDLWEAKPQRMALRYAMIDILANDDEGCRRFARQLFHPDLAMQPLKWPSEEEVIGTLRQSKEQLDLFSDGTAFGADDNAPVGEDNEIEEPVDLEGSNIGSHYQTSLSAHQTPSVSEIEAVASPTAILNSASEIDLSTNPRVDPSDDADNILDFPEIQVVQIGVILASLPGNAPKGLTFALIAYKAELEKRGARPIIGILTNQHAIIDAEYRHTDASDWLPSGMKQAAFPDFFKYHRLFLQHFPFMFERERVIARINVDESKATGEDLIRPFRAALEMAKAAQTAGVATSDVVQFMQELKQGAESLASLPSDAPIIDLGKDARISATSATPKQRLIGTAVGFLERAYNLLGTSVTLGTATYPAIAQNLASILKMLKSLMHID